MPCPLFGKFNLLHSFFMTRTTIVPVLLCRSAIGLGVSERVGDDLLRVCCYVVTKVGPQ